MNEQPDNTVIRALIIGVLMLATLGFGLAGMCGALFTVLGLASLSSSGAENYAAAFLIISVPSLLIGGGLAWWCGRKLSKRL
jgi:hypothetical protein